MNEDFTHKELQIIVRRAKYLAELKSIDPEWKRAYERLEDAALILDSFGAVEDSNNVLLD